MFCPKCATQHVDGASFCRSCGANISLIPQALSGQLQTAPVNDRYDRVNDRIDRAFKHKRRREPSLDEGIRHLMMGLAFIVISVLVGKYSPGGWTWWYWMLIPASTFLGRGISDIVRARQIKSGRDLALDQRQLSIGEPHPGQGPPGVAPDVPGLIGGQEQGRDAPFQLRMLRAD